MEVGGFFEMYSIKKEGYIVEFTNQLNINVTKKDKSKPDSPYMAGVPTHSLKKFLDILVGNNYTIVLIEQTEKDPTGKYEFLRDVTKIFSKSNYDIYNGFTTPDSNNLLCIYL